MTDKELRRLKRDDLLQILINQQRQIDELTESLRVAEAELEKRDIKIEEAGSVAEAALRLNGVFEAAQAAADQYEAQMRVRADEAMRLADDVLASARAEADRILSGAREEAEALRQAALAGPGAESASAAPAEEDKGRRGLFRRNKRA